MAWFDLQGALKNTVNWAQGAASGGWIPGIQQPPTQPTVQQPNPLDQVIKFANDTALMARNIVEPKKEILSPSDYQSAFPFSGYSKSVTDFISPPKQLSIKTVNPPIITQFESLNNEQIRNLPQYQLDRYVSEKQGINEVSPSKGGLDTARYELEKLFTNRINTGAAVLEPFRGIPIVNYALKDYEKNVPLIVREGASLNEYTNPNQLNRQAQIADVINTLATNKLVRSNAEIKPISDELSSIYQTLDVRAKQINPLRTEVEKEQRYVENYKPIYESAYAAALANPSNESLYNDAISKSRIYDQKISSYNNALTPYNTAISEYENTPEYKRSLVLQPQYDKLSPGYEQNIKDLDASSIEQNKYVNPDGSLKQSARPTTQQQSTPMQSYVTYPIYKGWEIGNEEIMKAYSAKTAGITKFENTGINPETGEKTWMPEIGLRVLGGGERILSGVAYLAPAALYSTALALPAFEYLAREREKAVLNVVPGLVSTGVGMGKQAITDPLGFTGMLVGMAAAGKVVEASPIRVGTAITTGEGKVLKVPTLLGGVREVPLSIEQMSALKAGQLSFEHPTLFGLGKPKQIIPTIPEIKTPYIYYQPITKSIDSALGLTSKWDSARPLAGVTMTPKRTGMEFKIPTSTDLFKTVDIAWKAQDALYPKNIPVGAVSHWDNTPILAKNVKSVYRITNFDTGEGYFLQPKQLKLLKEMDAGITPKTAIYERYKITGTNPAGSIGVTRPPTLEMSTTQNFFTGDPTHLLSKVMSEGYTPSGGEAPLITRMVMKELAKAPTDTALKAAQANLNMMNAAYKIELPRNVKSPYETSRDLWFVNKRNPDAIPELMGIIKKHDATLYGSLGEASFDTFIGQMRDADILVKDPVAFGRDLMEWAKKQRTAYAKDGITPLSEVKIRDVKNGQEYWVKNKAGKIELRAKISFDDNKATLTMRDVRGNMNKAIEAHDLSFGSSNGELKAWGLPTEAPIIIDGIKVMSPREQAFRTFSSISGLHQNKLGNWEFAPDALYHAKRVADASRFIDNLITNEKTTGLSKFTGPDNKAFYKEQQKAMNAQIGRMSTDIKGYNTPSDILGLSYKTTVQIEPPTIYPARLPKNAKSDWSGLKIPENSKISKVVHHTDYSKNKWVLLTEEEHNLWHAMDGGNAPVDTQFYNKYKITTPKSTTMETVWTDATPTIQARWGGYKIRPMTDQYKRSFGTRSYYNYDNTAMSDIVGTMKDTTKRSVNLLSPIEISSGEVPLFRSNEKIINQKGKLTSGATYVQATTGKGGVGTQLIAKVKRAVGSKLPETDLNVIGGVLTQSKKELVTTILERKRNVDTGKYDTVYTDVYSESGGLPESIKTNWGISEDLVTAVKTYGQKIGGGAKKDPHAFQTGSFTTTPKNAEIITPVITEMIRRGGTPEDVAGWQAIQDTLNIAPKMKTRPNTPLITIFRNNDAVMALQKISDARGNNEDIAFEILKIIKEVKDAIGGGSVAESAQTNIQSPTGDLDFYTLKHKQLCIKLDVRLSELVGRENLKLTPGGSGTILDFRRPVIGKSGNVLIDPKTNLPMKGTWEKAFEAHVPNFAGTSKNKVGRWTLTKYKPVVIDDVKLLDIRELTGRKISTVGLKVGDAGEVSLVPVLGGGGKSKVIPAAVRTPRWGDVGKTSGLLSELSLWSSPKTRNKISAIQKDLMGIATPEKDVLGLAQKKASSVKFVDPTADYFNVPLTKRHIDIGGITSPIKSGLTELFGKTGVKTEGLTLKRSIERGIMAPDSRTAKSIAKDLAQKGMASGQVETQIAKDIWGTYRTVSPVEVTTLRYGSEKTPVAHIATENKGRTLKQGEYTMGQTGVDITKIRDKQGKPLVIKQTVENGIVINYVTLDGVDYITNRVGLIDTIDIPGKSTTGINIREGKSTVISKGRGTAIGLEKRVMGDAVDFVPQNKLEMDIQTAVMKRGAETGAANKYAYKVQQGVNNALDIAKDMKSQVIRDPFEVLYLNDRFYVNGKPTQVLNRVMKRLYTLDKDAEVGGSTSLAMQQKKARMNTGTTTKPGSMDIDIGVSSGREHAARQIALDEFRKEFGDTNIREVAMQEGVPGVIQRRINNEWVDIMDIHERSFGEHTYGTTLSKPLQVTSEGVTFKLIDRKRIVEDAITPMGYAKRTWVADPTLPAGGSYSGEQYVGMRKSFGSKKIADAIMALDSELQKTSNTAKRTKIKQAISDIKLVAEQNYPQSAETLFKTTQHIAKEKLAGRTPTQTPHVLQDVVAKRMAEYAVSDVSQVSSKYVRIPGTTKTLHAPTLAEILDLGSSFSEKQPLGIPGFGPLSNINMISIVRGGTSEGNMWGLKAGQSLIEPGVERTLYKESYTTPLEKIAAHSGMLETDIGIGTYRSVNLNDTTNIATSPIRNAKEMKVSHIHPTINTAGSIKSISKNQLDWFPFNKKVYLDELSKTPTSLSPEDMGTTASAVKGEPRYAQMSAMTPDKIVVFDAKRPTMGILRDRGIVRQNKLFEKIKDVDTRILFESKQGKDAFNNVVISELTKYGFKQEAIKATKLADGDLSSVINQLDKITDKYSKSDRNKLTRALAHVQSVALEQVTELRGKLLGGDYYGITDINPTTGIGKTTKVVLSYGYEKLLPRVERVSKTIERTVSRENIRPRMVLRTGITNSIERKIIPISESHRIIAQEPLPKLIRGDTSVLDEVLGKVTYDTIKPPQKQKPISYPKQASTYKKDIPLMAMIPQMYARVTATKTPLTYGENYKKSEPKYQKTSYAYNYNKPVAEYTKKYTNTTKEYVPITKPPKYAPTKYPNTQPDYPIYNLTTTYIPINTIEYPPYNPTKTSDYVPPYTPVKVPPYTPPTYPPYTPVKVPPYRPYYPLVPPPQRTIPYIPRDEETPKLKRKKKGRVTPKHWEYAPGTEPDEVTDFIFGYSSMPKKKNKNKDDMVDRLSSGMFNSK